METWYVPKFNRMATLNLPEGEGLHGLPWASFLIQFVNIIWLFALAATIWTARKSPDQVLLGRRKRLFFPTTLILLSWALRLLVYLVVEMNFAHRTFAKTQYTRWASTFAASSETSATEKQARPFTYQFRPWWIIIPVMFLGAALLVLGCKFEIMVWARFAGGAILVEMIVRILVEICWTHSSWLRSNVTRIVSRYLPERLRQLPRASFPHPKMSRANIGDTL